MKPANELPERECVEVGVLEYLSASQRAAADFANIIHVSNELAAAGRHMSGKRIVVSRWRLSPADQRVRRVDGLEHSRRERPSVVVIAPAVTPMAELHLPPELLNWLGHCHDAGIIIAGCCAGTVCMARAGLLAGRCVSAQGLLAEQVGRFSPDARVQSDREIIDDGDLITASGDMALSHLALRLIERIHGAAVMSAVTTHLSLEINDRTQYELTRFSPGFAHGDKAILKAQRWLHINGARNVNLAGMAESAGLEPRTFQRRFLKATTMRPIEYCQRLRVDRAQQMFRAGLSVEEASWSVGYADQSAFRRLFLKLVGMTPAAYRRSSLAIGRRESINAMPALRESHMTLSMG